MTDRELLELAAKASGITVIRSRLDDPLNLDILIENSPRNKFQHSGAWNPLTDDGDALRLVVKLHMMIDYITRADSYKAGCVVAVAGGKSFYEDGFTTEATRRAIVFAAAELGKEST